MKKKLTCLCFILFIGLITYLVYTILHPPIKEEFENKPISAKEDFIGNTWYGILTLKDIPKEFKEKTGYTSETLPLYIQVNKEGIAALVGYKNTFLNVKMNKDSVLLTSDALNIEYFNPDIGAKDGVMRIYGIALGGKLTETLRIVTETEIKYNRLSFSGGSATERKTIYKDSEQLIGGGSMLTSAGQVNFDCIFYNRAYRYNKKGDIK